MVGLEMGSSWKPNQVAVHRENPSAAGGLYDIRVAALSLSIFKSFKQHVEHMHPNTYVRDSRATLCNQGGEKDLITVVEQSAMLPACKRYSDRLVMMNLLVLHVSWYMLHAPILCRVQSL